MKRLFVISFTSLVLASCNGSESRLHEMNSPIIVVGISETGLGCVNSGSVLLRDASGKIFEFGCYTNIARAICDSYQVGDTLR